MVVLVLDSGLWLGKQVRCLDIGMEVFERDMHGALGKKRRVGYAKYLRMSLSSHLLLLLLLLLTLLFFHCSE